MFEVLIAMSALSLALARLFVNIIN